MRLTTLLLPLLLLAFAGAADASAKGRVEKALAEQSRPLADRERDLRDKPAEVLALAGFRRGDVVADVFGGGGYYSEILSGIVGKRGRVLLVNNPQYAAYARKDQETRFAGDRLANVERIVAPTAALGLGERQLDGAIMVMAYHDLYWVDEKEGWPAIDAAQFLGQLAAALKPGGVLLVVDHAARDGSGKADAQTLHRIDEQFAIADFRANGLEWVASIPALRRTDDDRGKNVFDPAIRGRTDRFVHLYRKPE
jgi:predicted methyltransferase